MRPPSGPELLLFGRVLVTFPPDQRATVAVKILDEIELAATHLRHHGRCHPTLGDGSLMARCLGLNPTPAPPTNDSEFLTALIQACIALLHHQDS